MQLSLNLSTLGKLNEMDLIESRKINKIRKSNECWFKHILFMMKRIGRGLKCDKSPLLEGLFTRELTHTHSHTT